MERHLALLKRILTATLVLAATDGAIALAADNAAQQIVGLWKITSYAREDVETKKKVDIFGEKPSGYLNYLPNGRMMVVLVGDNRKPPAAKAVTDAERIALYSSMIAAYTGTYTIDGGKVIHHIDVSWNQAWTGTKQLRHFTIDGNKLRIFNPPRKSQVDGRMVTSVLTFEKVE